MKMDDLSKTSDGGFLQSEHWMKFQQSVGRKVTMLKQADGAALIIEYELPLVGSYFFVPRGPIITENSKQKTVDSIVENMIAASKKPGVGWIRVEPQSQEALELIKQACKQRRLTIVKSKKNHEPAQTLMLDLTKSEQLLLSGMKQKTRYNIRLAEKKGVEIVTSRAKEDIERFCNLVEETAKRDKVVAHPRSYYVKMLESITEEALVLYQANYQGSIIAGALVSLAGDVATYQHGASSNEHRNVMASYLLQWYAVKDAKNKGYKKYDFGGVKLQSNSNDPAFGSWQGITKFKLGFCPSGGVVNFPGCYDIIINRKKYWTYRFIQKLKDTLRKFR